MFKAQNYAYTQDASSLRYLFEVRSVSASNLMPLDSFLIFTSSFVLRRCMPKERYCYLTDKGAMGIP